MFMMWRVWFTREELSTMLQQVQAGAGVRRRRSSAGCDDRMLDAFEGGLGKDGTPKREKSRKKRDEMNFNLLVECSLMQS
jgi:hypothetical protein